MPVNTPIYPWSPVSDAYGKIDTILITYPGDVQNVSATFIKARYSNLFKAFGDRVKFVVLGTFREGADGFVNRKRGFFESFREAMQESHLHPDHHFIGVAASLTSEERVEGHQNHSEWSQDHFTVVQRWDGTTALLEPLIHLHSHNASVAEQVASQTDILIKPTQLHLEGGNILVGDDYALVGMNLLKRNERLMGEDSIQLETETLRNKVITAFKRELGVNYLIEIGREDEHRFKMDLSQGPEAFQPIFHIDHFITLAGKNKKGEELVYVAEIDADYIFGASNEVLAEIVDELNKWLDEIVKFLKETVKKRPGPNFEVARMPLPLMVNEKEQVIPFSYNNAQVEWYLGIKRIYLPQYRPEGFEELHPKFKDAETTIVNDLGPRGFSCTYVDNAFDRYILQGGSLHCLTKVLKRTHF